MERPHFLHSVAHRVPAVSGPPAQQHTRAASNPSLHGQPKSAAPSSQSGSYTLLTTRLMETKQTPHATLHAVIYGRGFISVRGNKKQQYFSGGTNLFTSPLSLLDNARNEMGKVE